MTGPPDVTVIVAVYNTMPYLTECLTSLVEQSIGLERMEIVAVDDGSTDGGGKELDRFASLYPDTFTVVHQANSGGPAAPSNRALDLATGRYVLFLGSDDHLGLEALERLVAGADTFGSDVMLGKTVGVNGRNVLQTVYRSTRAEISLFDSALPWSLSNTKLFRRDFVERHHLRYPEHMPVGSDQPFTIEACVRARRISVLADYVYYYAVRRLDASNITYRTGHLTRLACAEEIMRFTAGLLEPGPKRDAVLRRHFSWEISKLFTEDFLDLSPALQGQLCAGAGRLLNEYATETIWAKLGPRRRLRLVLAQRGSLDLLREAIRQEGREEPPPVAVEDGRAYLRLLGFGDPLLAMPKDWFAFAGSLSGAISDRLGKTFVSRAKPGRSLALTVRVAVTFDPAVLRIALVPLSRDAEAPQTRQIPHDQVPGSVDQLTLETRRAGPETVIHARIPALPLVKGARRQAVLLYVQVGEATYEIPVPAPADHHQHRVWRGVRPYRITTGQNESEQLILVTKRVRPARQVRARLRRLAYRLGRTSS